MIVGRTVTSFLAALALVLALVLTYGSPSHAASPSKPPEKSAAEETEPDHLNIARVLVRDGHFDRADAALTPLDISAPDTPPETVIAYWKLKGVIALGRKRFDEAATAFESAIEAGASDPLLHVYAAQAHFQTKAYDKVLTSLQRAGKDRLDAMPRLKLLAAQAQWKLGRYPEAFATLQQTETRHPDLTDATRLKVYLLIDRGLYRTAARYGRSYLERTSASVDDYLALAESLRRGRALGEAQNLLEIARLRAPQDPNILVALARTYADLGKPLTGAGLFERAALLETTGKRADSHTMAAAELYRRAGRLYQATLVNARVREQTPKIRQRMGLLVERERFEEAAALAPRVERLGLDRDDSVVYAVAFSLFRTHQYKSAERWLRRLKSAEMFAKAAELRKAIVACRTGTVPCD